MSRGMWYEYRPLIGLVALINVLGTIFGFLYYQYMFDLVPWYMWPVVPDSPGSTLLFAIAMALFYFGRKKDWLSFLACASTIKYGLWTIFVILYFPEHFLAPAVKNFYYLMIFLHFGMVIQVVVLLHTIERKRKYLFIVLLWFFTNDYFDYVLGTGPLTTHGLNLEVVGFATAGLSAASGLAVYYITKGERES
jgi:uncharacterized membrane protein YpjA